MAKINMISGNLWKRDSVTSYDLSLGDRSFKSIFSTDDAFSIQIEWESLDANDAVVKVYGSNDNENFDLLPGSSSKTLNSANGSYSFVKDDFNWEYIAIELTVNSVTSGTLKANLNIKE